VRFKQKKEKNALFLKKMWGKVVKYGEK